MEPHLFVPDGSTLTNQLGSTSSPGGPGYKPARLHPHHPGVLGQTTPPSLLTLIAPLIPRKQCLGKRGRGGKKKKAKTKKLAAHKSPNINMDDFHANAEETWREAVAKA